MEIYFSEKWDLGFGETRVLMTRRDETKRTESVTTTAPQVFAAVVPGLRFSEGSPGRDTGSGLPGVGFRVRMRCVGRSARIGGGEACQDGGLRIPARSSLSLGHAGALGPAAGAPFG